MGAVYRFDRISDFVKIARKRYEDSVELLENPTSNSEQSDASFRHLRAAMYLSGYSVECMLKAYICSQENCQSLGAAVARINRKRKKHRLGPARDIAFTSAGHNIHYLLTLTDLSTRNGYDRFLFGRLAKWNTGWRYDHTAVRRALAVEFVKDVNVTLKWIGPKI